ncbi:hypothetical protein HZH66_012257 [Vespula vulgaris]|uniref:U3 small nucleolar RNA-associated protein 15 homolog n=1 Tax=Vespula vulgaris TaxID=7454 RepID=A0A834JGQ3_VESVU|nr:hypothetical protein HZH66_012257 [Vespula vulgaris]
MASFKKTNSKIFMRAGPEITPDNIYWKKYTAPVLVKEFGPIDYIDFSPVEPHYFAVTCSVRVQIYNPITKLVTKNFSRFKEAAYGGSFRRDGKLLCAGGEESVIRLFDVSTKSLLRLFSGHKAAVHRTFFTADNLHIASFSDDKTVVLWDIVNHEAPVESILFLPSGGIFLSAGGTDVKVWDALAGGRLLAKLSQHHKTVTCLKITSNGHRILSGSLDRHIKIYDSGTYKTVHTLDYPNSVLSMGISANDETIVAGMVDGLISVQRKEEDIKDTKVKRKKMSYKNAGENTYVSSVDTVVQEEVKETMSKHDTWLRKFQYSKALDSVMLPYVINKTPHVTVALLQELNKRQGLRQALAGRDGKSLANIIKFLIRYIGNVRFGRVLLHVANVLMDVYEDNLDGLAAEPRNMFNLLANKLQEEEDLIVSLAQLQGTLQIILSGAEAQHITTARDNQTLEPSSAAQKNLIFSIA